MAVGIEVRIMHDCVDDFELSRIQAARRF